MTALSQPPVDHRRPPLPHWDAPARRCRWCGRDGETGQYGGHEYAVGGWWHEDCLTAYAIAVSSKAQRHFVGKRDLGLCAGCGANAEQAMFRAMQDDPRPPFYGWQIVRVMKRWIDPDFHCVANSTWFRPALPPWQLWEADHIVPLWSLENLQTLCVDCHRAKSARETSARAAAKREPSLQLGLPLESEAL